jgi:hypothetical protein
LVFFYNLDLFYKLPDLVLRVKVAGFVHWQSSVPCVLKSAAICSSAICALEFWARLFTSNPSIHSPLASSLGWHTVELLGTSVLVEDPDWLHCGTTATSWPRAWWLGSFLSRSDVPHTPWELWKLHLPCLGWLSHVLQSSIQRYDAPTISHHVT